MKKIIMTLALTVAVGLAGFNIAQARWGGGSGNGPGNCNGPGGWSKGSSVSYEEMEKFHEDTVDLRKQIFEKRSAYSNLMTQENPDKDLAKQIWSEMFDLQNEMHTKALAAGMPAGNAKRGFGMRGRF